VLPSIFILSPPHLTFKKVLMKNCRQHFNWNNNQWQQTKK
jgi:hypothetical protein